jgi:UDPglucose--hexose-1-phosphate uridylyltransferase
MNLELPHRRFNPLTRDWVIVSPQRTLRPWLGQVEKPVQQDIPAYDPECTLCPGNIRSSGARNPLYTGTFVFDNDFPALLSPELVEPAGELTPEIPGGDLFTAQPEYGTCRVVCFSPRHDLQIPQMHQLEIEAVVRTWSEQTLALGSQDFIQIPRTNQSTLSEKHDSCLYAQCWKRQHGEFGWSSATIATAVVRSGCMAFELLDRQPACR